MLSRTMPVVSVVRWSVPNSFRICEPKDQCGLTTTIGHMTVKTEVGDGDKIGVIQKLIQDHVQVDRIIDLIQAGSSRQLHLGM